MLRNILFLYICLASIVYVSAQDQKGLVVIQNSGKSPLPQVSVVVQNASPTTSDASGKFQLQLPNHTRGQQLFVQEITYKDWVVVNMHSVEQWVYAPDKTYRIDMCPKQDYEKRVEQLYNIGHESSKAEYNKCITQLKSLKEQGKVCAEAYATQLRAAQEDLKRANSMLNKYVPIIVSINLDYLTPFEQKAQRLIMDGKLAEAISLYEQLNLEQRFHTITHEKKNIDEELETMIPTMQRYAQTLILRGGGECYSKAGEILKMIADCSPMDGERNADYAGFAMEQMMFHDAEIYYGRAISNLRDITMRLNCCITLARLYNMSKQTDKCEEALDKVTSELESLPDYRLSTAIIYTMLNDEISKWILNKAKEMPYEERKGFYEGALEASERAVDNATLIVKEMGNEYAHLLSSCYDTQISIYTLLGKDDKVKKLSKLMESISVSSDNEEEQMFHYYEQGRAFMNSGNSDQAIEYILKAKQLCHNLYQKNPDRYLHTYVVYCSHLGLAYNNKQMFDQAIEVLNEGISLYRKLPQEVVSHLKQEYIALLQAIMQSYFYKQRYNDIVDIYRTLSPDILSKNTECSPTFWMYTLYAHLLLGDFSLLEHQLIILESIYPLEEDKEQYIYVEACYNTLAEMNLEVGNFTRYTTLMSLCDECAKKHNHHLMLVYNQLNMAKVFTMLNNPQEVLDREKNIRHGLQRYGGDEESFVMLEYRLLIASLKLKDWTRVQQYSQQLEARQRANSPSAANSGVYLTQYMAQRLKGYNGEKELKNFLDSCSVVKASSLHQYEQLMADYHLCEAALAVQQSDYAKVLIETANAQPYLMQMQLNSPERSAFMVAYCKSMAGDALIANKQYLEGFKTYEQGLGSFFSIKFKPAEMPYISLYDWNLTLLLFSQVQKFEGELRALDTPQAAYLSQAFFALLYGILHQSDDVPHLIEYLRGRKVPETNIEYIPALIYSSKEMKKKLDPSYYFAVDALLELLRL